MVFKSPVARVKMLKGFPLEIKLMLGLIIFEFCDFDGFLILISADFMWFLVLVCGMPLVSILWRGVLLRT